MIPNGQKGYPCVVIKSKEDENYFLYAAKEVKPIIGNVPLMLVGGIRDPFIAENILREKYADFISLCRPFIREPDLVKRWEQGDYSSVKCISCNGCFDTIVGKTSMGLECAVEKRKREKNK